MSNVGTSFKFLITNQKLQPSYEAKVTRYEGQAVNTPVPTSFMGQASYGVKKWQNPFPDISFQKIILPDYEGVYNYTTTISNEPDYIKDYHFIALMRCIDFYNAPAYQAIIKATGTGVKPKGT